MFGFLDALNNACFDYSFSKTLPFTEKQENVIHRYMVRRNYINKLRIKFYKGFKRG